MTTPQPYRVLARKYRPTTFSDLIGQEVLVRTLSNAFESNRIAHAFLLTGIRGIGKTTTARIIARALNCIGNDGNGGPTITPCGVCPNCAMIGEDRHVDVLEMDAASHTGVNDIRDIIETVHYAPTNARYKIYIIDEVHMLSNSAFNALLKTLEEPPPHVKFIFATTEIRKIPVTILSRCQRFDLRRVDIDMLAQHLANIAAKEQVQADEDALRLIAVAAEGSVRDGLSLLDQAIAHGHEKISADIVHSMLGLVDRAQSFNLLEPLCEGNIIRTLDEFKQLYNAGADPILILQDLLEITHFVTRMKLVPSLHHNLSYPEMERNRATILAEKLDIPFLSRLWQMLLKGLQESRYAPNPTSAVEMVLTRIAYAADLPSPADLVRQLQNGSEDISAPSRSFSPTRSQGNLAMAPASMPSSMPHNVPTAHHKPVLELVTNFEPMLEIKDFTDAVTLFEQKREPLLHSYLIEAKPVSFTQGKIEINPNSRFPHDFAARVSKALTGWTGQEWKLAFSNTIGEASVSEQITNRRAALMREASTHPLVQAIKTEFPGAEIVDITNKE